MTRRAALALALSFVALAGCGGPPPVHPITGKVTLGGKAYDRLLVYFRPASGEVTQYNLGVGETDKDGNLALKSSAGTGIAAGKYKVTFSSPYLKSAGGTQKAVGADDKPDDDRNQVVVERVGPPYDDATSQAATPVEFEVKPGGNTFTFDIPVKK